MLCGRNAVQLSPLGSSASIAGTTWPRSWRRGPRDAEPVSGRALIGDYVLTLFPDGRAIIGGTDDIATARGVYAKYVGT